MYLVASVCPSVCASTSSLHGAVVPDSWATPLPLQFSSSSVRLSHLSRLNPKNPHSINRPWLCFYKVCPAFGMRKMFYGTHLKSVCIVCCSVGDWSNVADKVRGSLGNTEDIDQGNQWLHFLMRQFTIAYGTLQDPHWFLLSKCVCMDIYSSAMIPYSILLILHHQPLPPSPKKSTLKKEGNILAGGGLGRRFQFLIISTHAPADNKWKVLNKYPLSLKWDLCTWQSPSHVMPSWIQ